MQKDSESFVLYILWRCRRIGHHLYFELSGKKRYAHSDFISVLSSFLCADTETHWLLYWDIKYSENAEGLGVICSLNLQVKWVYILRFHLRAFFLFMRQCCHSLASQVRCHGLIICNVSNAAPGITTEHPRLKKWKRLGGMKLFRVCSSRQIISNRYIITASDYIHLFSIY